MARPLRPSEAVILREADLHLPGEGRGWIDLAASASRAGTAWTSQGTSRQERGLKYRAANEIRTIPIPPEFVKLLRATSSDTAPLSTGGSPRPPGADHPGSRLERRSEARKNVLTEARYRSPLGHRPYDLRH